MIFWASVSYIAKTQQLETKCHKSHLTSTSLNNTDSESLHCYLYWEERKKIFFVSRTRNPVVSPHAGLCSVPHLLVLKLRRRKMYWFECRRFVLGIRVQQSWERQCPTVINEGRKHCSAWGGKLLPVLCIYGGFGQWEGNASVDSWGLDFPKSLHSNI